MLILTNCILFVNRFVGSSAVSAKGILSSKQNAKQYVKKTDKPPYKITQYDPFKLSLSWYNTFVDHLNIKNNQQVK